MNSLLNNVLKIIELNNQGNKRYLNGVTLFSLKDLSSTQKHFSIGEWILLKTLNGETLISFCSPYSEKGFFIQLVSNFPVSSHFSEGDILAFITNSIDKSVRRRELLIDDFPCCRLVYGGFDLLPGLVIDGYENHILININSTGLDLYRKEIINQFKSLFPQKNILYRENHTYRKREGLPQYDQDEIKEGLIATENDLSVCIDPMISQKNGYYYDHRLNRLNFIRLLKKFNFSSGLDLFSYVGPWGLGMLKNGFNKVDFVDQGNMKPSIEKSLNKNSLNNAGDIYRDDVFKFLQKSVSCRYDVVCCDPPAFAKSLKQKSEALKGYRKLIKNIVPLLNDKSLLVFASCTKYVSYSELDQLVKHFLNFQKLSFQLLFNGIQDYDHPIKSLDDDNNYIKCLIYYIEKDNNELSGKDS
ncbi:hypothetical protein N9N67_08265 [Bacteriovoracaceae bacterium]|nr:hypothetical protein [Bacteriovoracaceae bacterium]